MPVWSQHLGRETIKFALDQNEAGNIIRSYEPGRICIKGDEHESCILISETAIWTDWGQEDCLALSKRALKHIVSLGPDIAIFGTGEKQIFPDPRILIPLMDARIGYEIMDTAAACRTYNVLISEDRNVVALLMP